MKWWTGARRGIPRCAPPSDLVGLRARGGNILVVAGQRGAEASRKPESAEREGPLADVVQNLEAASHYTRSSNSITKFRITHPCHPLTGREFEALACKELYGGEQRVCFLDKKGRECEIPLSWTDLAPDDALATLAAGKSWFRAADLLDLARLVEALRR